MPLGAPLDLSLRPFGLRVKASPPGAVANHALESIEKEHQTRFLVPTKQLT